MKNKILLTLVLLNFFLFAEILLAQSSSPKILFEGEVNSNSYQIVTSTDDVFSVKVPISYLPSVHNLGNISLTRFKDGDSYVFSFEIPINTVPKTKFVENSLEIKFIPIGNSSSNQSIPSQTATNLNSPVSFSKNNIKLNEPQNNDSNTKANPAPTPTATPDNTTPSEKCADTTKEKNLCNESLKTANVDFTVPDSPGFVILGLTPQTVVRPSSPREFATSVINGFDQNGNFQNGIAVDTAPYLLFLGKDTTILNYRNNYLTRLLSQTQLSLATTKGTSEDDKSARLGVGLNLTLFDRADPRLDRQLDKCFDDKVKAEPPIPPFAPNREALIKEREDRLKKVGETCRSEWKERSVGKSSWTLGTAASWISDKGNISNLRWNGAAFWTSFAFGFEGVQGLEKKAQLIFHFRHRTKEQVPDPEIEGKFFEKDSSLFGTRLRFGKPTFAGNFEAVFIRDKRVGKEADSNFRFSAGAERKITSNLYFSISFGGETQKDDKTGKKAFVLTNFRWGGTNEPTQIDQ